MQEKIETFYKILPNGAKIVHRKCDSPVAYLGIMVGAGTRDELPEESGMAHYIEHCVFKGTEHYSARQLIDRIEGTGGEINAYTTKEETTFYAAVPTEHWHQALHTLLDMVARPTFPKEETDKEVNVILDEIESYNDSPSELIYDDFEALLFRGSSLAMPVLGTRKTLRHISHKPDTPQRWMQQHYRPERMVFFSTGAMSFESVCKMWEKETYTLQNKWEPYRTLIEPLSNPCGNLIGRSQSSIQVAENERLAMRKRTHQTHILLGGYAYPIGHERQLTAYLLNNILGGGALNSRLNLSLREKSGLVYTVESTYTPLSDTGYWSVYMACDPEDKNHCLELVDHELRALSDKPLSATQLERAIRQIHGQMAIASENRENEALTMAKQMLYHGHAPLWTETFDKIKNIPSDELAACAGELYKNYSILTYE